VSGGAEFHLVPLDCPSCGASVEARGRDVVFYCTACRNGYRFDREERGLEPVEVGFVAVPQIAVERFLPFWVLTAVVTIHERQSTGGLPTEWLSLFFSASGGERSPRRGQGEFVVPAFQTPLGSTLELTRQYTRSFPHLGERLGERLVGGCYGIEDAEKLTHFAVIASEVEKRDTLKQLRYDIEFGEARLLGVPFVRDGDDWKDGLHGVKVELETR
jgi:hypothetical protein